MILYLLNLFDLSCTIYAINNGFVELNPIALAMLSVHPLCYAAYKIIPVGVLCLWLIKRPEKVAVYGLRLCTAVYAAIAVQHCVGIFGIF